MDKLRYVRRFCEVGIGDVGIVGGRNAALGEIYAKLANQGVRVPNGFATTADAYRHVLDAAARWRLELSSAGIWDELHEALDHVDPADVAGLVRAARRAREVVYRAGLPGDVAADIIAGCRALQAEYREDVSLAVRSSATAGDLQTASFAGQQETNLNIVGDESLLDACRRCYASLFTDRAIHYRIDQGFDLKIALTIGVMKPCRSG